MAGEYSKEIPRYVLGDFSDLTRIDHGTGGNVYCGKLADIGVIALKEFNCKYDALDKYKKEIEILIEHKHANIVSIYGILWDGENESKYLGYVMEYLSQGSLRNIIYNPEKIYNFQQISTWIEQISSGLQFLHKNGIVHRDIKPGNILVADAQLKLADFGVAKKIDASTTAGAGTYFYMAPEVWSHGKSGKPVDIYSLAITIWEMFHRKVPYYEVFTNGNLPMYALSTMIIGGVRPTIEPEKMGNDVTQLIIRCWQNYPDMRPTIEGIADTFKKIANNTMIQFEYRVMENMGASDTILLTGGLINNNLGYNGMVIWSRKESKWIELVLKQSRNTMDFGGGAVYFNDAIYFLGGLATPKTLHKLDKNLKWIRLADMNIGRFGITNSCIEWNGCIWVFGGMGENKEYSNSVEKYDPKEDTWEIMPDMKYARGGASVNIWNDFLVICGGFIEEKEETNTIECFSFYDGIWIDLPQMPDFIVHHALVVYKSKLIVIGGEHGKTHNKVWELDLDETKPMWKFCQLMKHPAAHFQGIIFDNEIYVIGGCQGIDESLDRVEIFDGEHWRDAPSLPYKWKGMSAMVISQRLAERLLIYKR